MINYNTDQEVWKEVVGYEGLYKVSSHGRIWSCRQNKIMKQRISKGYAIIGLSKNGESKRVSVHRLIAKAFIENPENKREVNHLDENKLNNHVSNLQWVTPKENANWGTRNQRISEYVKANPVPAKARAIAQFKPIHQIDPITNKVVAKHESVKDALKALGSNPKTGALSTCLTGNGPNKTYKGYKWKYADEVTQ